MNTELLDTYPKYDSYKDSGIKELGKVPKDWELLSNKHIFSIKNVRVGKKSEDYDLLSLTLKGIIKRDMENPQGKFPAEFDTYQEVSSGDFVFCLFDVEETPRTVGLSEFDGMITGAYTVLEVSPSFDKNFIYYFYLNLDNEKMLKPLYRGLRNTIPKDWFMSYKTFIPTYEEQTAIANFLDQKTTQIDQAINLKQQQIEKLNEYKQILIQNAVTKGLNPDAEMKDSGIDWMGNIPKYWEVKKLKYLGQSIIGLTYSPMDLTTKDKGVLVLRSSNLQNGKFYYSDKANVFVSTKISPKLMLRKDDILICSRNGSRDLIGKCAIAKISDLGSTFGAFTTVFRSPLNPYLYYILNSNVFKFLSGSFLTSTINQLTIGNLNSIQLPIPPKVEQQKISEYLDNLLLVFERAEKNYQSQIDSLKKYKTVLINDAVTGKIKVS